MKFLGKYPAVVASYSGAPRQCRVKIPGITDGAQLMPLAEICYPIGDKGNTEIEILAGDLVWVEFEAGDSRYPIIVGWRNKNTSNVTGWRRWHQANVELLADQEFHVQCTTLIFDVSGDATINANNATVNATVKAQVSAAEVDITATTKVQVQAPEIDLLGVTNIYGDLNITGNVSATGTAGFMTFNINGSLSTALGVMVGEGIEATGNIITAGDVRAGTISLVNHTHPFGGGNTGAPNP